MRKLKQSTAVTIPFGPALDKTDGNTFKTGLVSAIDHATTGIKLSKNGGAMTIRHATVTASTYDSYGNYIVTLDATDTNTLGTLRVLYGDNNTTALPIWDDYEVVPAGVWDAEYSATGAIPNLGILDRGTVANLLTTTTKQLAAASAFGTNTLTGCILGMLGGTNAPYWQYSVITSNTNAAAANVVTYPAFVVEPTGTSTYIIFGSPVANTALKVPATIAAGDLATDSITAAALKTDAVTEIANAVVEAEITALMTYNRSANTTATLTGPTSGSNSLGVATDATYLPIKTL